MVSSILRKSVNPFSAGRLYFLSAAASRVRSASQMATTVLPSAAAARSLSPLPPPPPMPAMPSLLLGLAERVMAGKPRPAAVPAAPTVRRKLRRDVGLMGSGLGWWSVVSGCGGGCGPADGSDHPPAGNERGTRRCGVKSCREEIHRSPASRKTCARTSMEPPRQVIVTPTLGLRSGRPSPGGQRRQLTRHPDRNNFIINSMNDPDASPRARSRPASARRLS